MGDLDNSPLATTRPFTGPMTPLSSTERRHSPEPGEGLPASRLASPQTILQPHRLWQSHFQGLLALELQVLPAQVLRPDPVHPNRRGLFRPLLPDQLQLHLLPQERQVPLVSGERTLPW